MSVPYAVLITGGAGFIGSSTAQLLLEKGHEVTVVDKTPRESAWRLASIPINNALRYVCMDLRDTNALKTLFATSRFDAIIHLAAMVSVCECEANESACFENNVDVTQRLAALALRDGVKRFVFASSAAVYGDSDALPLREDTPTHPISNYGRSKLMAEDVIQGHNHAMTVTTLRYFNVFGPRQEDTAYAGVMTHFFKNSIMGLPHLINGDGEQTRDFVFVSDIAKVNAYFCEYPHAGVFNVATSEQLTINKTSRLISASMKHECRVENRQRKSCDIYRSCGDITRLKAVIPNWPFTSIESGIEQTASYFLDTEKVSKRI